MNSRRIAVLAGVVGVLSTVVKVVPVVVLGGLFEQDLPEWLPTVGTLGQTVLLYNLGVDILGALVMIVLAVGVGYSVSQQLALTDEYQQFIGAIVAGTTVPLIVAWAGGIGGFLIGLFSGFELIVVTEIILRLFVTISLPVIVAVFAGAALAHFTTAESQPPEPNETNPDTSTLSVDT
jgi:hypothetical protein